MSTKTNQEIFNQVYRFITQQGKPAWNDVDGTCEYLAPDGCRCAIGCLMRDDPVSSKHASRIHQAVDILLGGASLYPSFRSLFDFEIRDNQEGFLRSLQVAHDEPAANVRNGGDFLPAFKAEMKSLASRYGLEFPKDAT